MQKLKVDDHIYFLTILINQNKMFQVLYIIQVNDKEINLKKSQTQTDQDSDMNIVAETFIQKMRLKLRSLSEIDFNKMLIWCADNYEILLHHWVYLEIEVKNIWRWIWCFIVSHDQTQTESQFSEKLSLLLNLLWLFTVNAVIYICDFKMKIDDLTVREKSHIIMNSELIFCWDHNLSHNFCLNFNLRFNRLSCLNFRFQRVDSKRRRSSISERKWISHH